MTYMVINHQVINGIIIFLFLMSIGIQIVTGIYLYQLIKETDNMTTTNDKFLKQCKLKFSHCYQLNEGVSNIPVFVDKCLQKIKVCGIPLLILKHVSGQIMLLSIVVSGIGACQGIIGGEGITQILPYYIISLLGLYIYFSITSIVDINGKNKVLKINLIDYLENHMINKLLILEEDKKIVDGAHIEESQKDNKKKAKLAIHLDREEAERDGEGYRDRKQKIVSQGVEKELEELLKEFLT